MARRRVAILGCTGSVGTQTLDVCRQHADKLEVAFLSAHSRSYDLVCAARAFSAPVVAVTGAASAGDPVLAELPAGTELRVGMDAAIDACLSDDVDIVVIAVVGAAGLSACYRLTAAGKTVAIANKESLVVGGDLIMPLARAGQLLPVDSEHSAIFQCLLGERASEAHLIWLTCSGGPFFGRTRAELAAVRPVDALAHPTWDMGAKITIDSATLMNKGLERIEAMHLFEMGVDDIQVLIHRQSKIHSMVEYADGSVIAHLGASDMRIPVQYALSYPERWETPAPRIDFRTLSSLTFDAPDVETFRCLALAEEAARTRGTMPCVLNAANEVAVGSFLARELPFTGIDEVVETVMESHAVEPVQTLEQLLAIDEWARGRAREVIRSRDR